MKPRMAVIGVRSSWLTFARNRDFASLARSSEAFVSLSCAGQRALIVEERRQTLARTVQVAGELSELIAVRHLDVLREVACRDCRKRAFRPSKREDERPRENESQHQRHDDARRREGDHHSMEEVARGSEVGLRRPSCLLPRL